MVKRAENASVLPVILKKSVSAFIWDVTLSTQRLTQSTEEDFLNSVFIVCSLNSKDYRALLESFAQQRQSKLSLSGQLQVPTANWSQWIFISVLPSL